MSAEVIKQITDAVIPVLVTVSLAMLPPLIAKGIAWARGKANETKIGAQSKIDDLFFDELEGRSPASRRRLPPGRPRTTAP